MLGSTLITEAAELFGDPAQGRISPGVWRIILNRVLRGVSMKMNVFEAETFFDIVTSSHRYAWPSDATQIRFVQYTDTPSDQESLQFLGEMVEEKWRTLTHGRYPVGAPRSYFARQGWFHLWPRADVAYEKGGLVAYWAIHPEIVVPEAESIVYPDMTRDYIVDGMLVQAAMRDKQLLEANALWQGWLSQLDEAKFRIEDRSDDRRPSLRPRVAGSIGSQV